MEGLLGHANKMMFVLKCIGKNIIEKSLTLMLLNFWRQTLIMVDSTMKFCMGTQTIKINVPNGFP